MLEFLRVVDSDYKPSIGFVMGMFDYVKSEIKAVYMHRESDYQPVIDVMEKHEEGWI